MSTSTSTISTASTTPTSPPELFAKPLSPSEGTHWLIVACVVLFTVICGGIYALRQDMLKRRALRKAKEGDKEANVVPASPPPQSPPVSHHEPFQSSTQRPANYARGGEKDVIYSCIPLYPALPPLAHSPRRPHAVARRAPLLKGGETYAHMRHSTVPAPLPQRVHFANNVRCG